MVKTKISQCCYAKSPTRAYRKLDSLYIVDDIYFLLQYKRDSDLATLPIVIDTRTTSKFTRHARCQQNVRIDTVDFNDVTIKTTVTVNDVIARPRYRLLLRPHVNTDINKKWDISFYDTALWTANLMSDSKYYRSASSYKTKNKFLLLTFLQPRCPLTDEERKKITRERKAAQRYRVQFSMLFRRHVNH